MNLDMLLIYYKTLEDVTCLAKDGHGDCRTYFKTNEGGTVGKIM